jgi:hypothetical protein
MEGRLNFGNAWYCSVHHILFLHLLIVVLERLKHTRPQFLLLFCMDVKLGLFRKERTTRDA